MTVVDGTGVADQGPPWLLRILCFVIPALPVYVVLPGALKGNGAPSRMIALIMFGLVLLSFFVVRRTEQRRINPGMIILLLYLAMWLIVYGVGLLNHDNVGTASNRTRAMLTIAAHVGVGLYVLARVRSGRQRDVLLGWLAAGLVFVCLVGVVQSVSSLDLRYFFQPPGFVLNTEDLQLSERMGVTRVRGTSQHAIEFSVLAAITIPLTIYLARRSVRRAARWVSGVGCLIAIVALPAAISRSGIISLLAALLVYLLAFRVRQIAVSLAVAATAVGGYVIAFPKIANALWATITGSADDESVSARIDDYTKVSNLLHERPLFGLGVGGSDPADFGYLDNEWMQAIVQGGLVGLTAMAAVMFGAVFGMAAALRGATAPRGREQAYLLGAMAVGILASSFTFDLFAFEQATLIFFILFGMLWSGFAVTAPEHHASPPLLERLVSSRSHTAPF